MITVRNEQMGDAEALAQVIASATATMRQIYRPNEKAYANKKRISQDLQRVVGVVDGRVVGTTQYYREGDCLRIIGLGVASDARRQGVARALVAALADSARSQGLRSLTMCTVKETGNVAIFDRLGFRVVSEQPDDYSESNTCEVLTDVELRMDL